MRMAKGFALLGVILLVGAALAGCGGSKQEVLRVGTEATFPPFETTDENDNIVGFDIDLIKKIAEYNEWELEIVHMDFHVLIEELSTDKIDIVIAAMTIDEERAEKVLFSEPYFDAYQCLVVREDEDRDITVDNIAEQGLIIAVQMGTTGSFAAEDIYGNADHPNIKQLKRANEAFMELKSNRADVVIIDKPVAENYIRHLGGMKILGQPFTNEQYGIAVKKGNTELMDKINSALAKMKDNGDYDAIFKKWFGE